ncbi:MAG: 16S rRNA (cytosine(967)-C(5))-methyltransferase RsmB [Pseudomonadota bacterium]
MASAPRADARAAAAVAVSQVCNQGMSLAAALPDLRKAIADQDRAFAQACVFGTLRFHGALTGALQRFLRKPLRQREHLVENLLLIGLFQIYFLRTPAHVAVNETVRACETLGKTWAKNLVNGVLRNATRNKLADDLSHSAKNHPPWFVSQIQNDHPDRWRSILSANLRPGPMTVRVNRGLGNREAYQETLHKQGIGATRCRFAEDGLRLQAPIGVEKLPGFTAGSCYVQDEAAQLACELLEVMPGNRVLDCCAAPGGKTTHILERHKSDDVTLIALDRSSARLAELEANLQRLKHQCDHHTANAAADLDWWDTQGFDRILLDAPCSASGIVRRYPDILHNRQPRDVVELQAQQRQILSNVWQLLNGGGRLLYATCSVFNAENDDTIAAFLGTHADADIAPISALWGEPTRFGRQILPGAGEMDGFYYAALVKHGA